jgi:hypothetical protein
VHAHGDAGHVERLTIGPDARDPRDLAFAKPDCERQRVAIIRAGRARPTAFAAANIAGLDVLLVSRRPNHLPSNAHAAEHSRQRRAFGGALHVQISQPRTFAAAGRAEKLAINGAAEVRASGPTKRTTNCAQRARQLTAKHLAHAGEN